MEKKVMSLGIVVLLLGVAGCCCKKQEKGKKRVEKMAKSNVRTTYQLYQGEQLADNSSDNFSHLEYEGDEDEFFTGQDLAFLDDDECDYDLISEDSNRSLVAAVSEGVSRN